MALTDFFRINFPYGIAFIPKMGWYAFNREYMPLGWHKKDHTAFNSSTVEEIQKISSFYKGLSEKLLHELADESDSIERDDSGEITRIWFYSDSNNPNNDLKNWEPYIKKIKKLAKLKVENK
ncbi:hypothetical protein [Pedobacter sp. N23S346]|uniref:hypothetical protein n=1 Tax=Pedobacter sp. N23S346 TaxID=3402750 RepID=UPI003ACD10AF